MIARLPRSAALALAAVLLAGCSLTRDAPVKATYLLEPAMPPAAAKTQPVSVRVAGVNVAAPFRGRPFVYRTGDLTYETDYYVEFLVPPAAMLAEQTTRALEAAHVFRQVVPPGSGADADYTLEGFVSSLYANINAGGPSATELVVTYYLAPATGGSVPIWSKEYRRHLDIPTRTPAGYVTTLNQAFGEVLAELTRDLAALPTLKPNT